MLNIIDQTINQFTSVIFIINRFQRKYLINNNNMIVNALLGV